MPPRPEFVFTSPEGDNYEDSSSILNPRDLGQLVSLPPVVDSSFSTQTALFGGTTVADYNYEISVKPHHPQAEQSNDHNSGYYQLSVPDGSNLVPWASYHEGASSMKSPAAVWGFRNGRSFDQLTAANRELAQSISTAQDGGATLSQFPPSTPFHQHGISSLYQFTTGIGDIVPFQTPPSSPSPLYSESHSLHLRTDFSAIERSAAVLGSPTNWSGYSSPASVPSSVPESPHTPSSSLYSHNSNYSGFPFLGSSLSSSREDPASPGSGSYYSTASELFRREVQNQNHSPRGRQPTRSSNRPSHANARVRRSKYTASSASRSSSASGSGRDRTCEDRSISPGSVLLDSDRLCVCSELVANESNFNQNVRRRAFSGPNGTVNNLRYSSDTLTVDTQLTLGPPLASRAQIIRGGRVSDSYLNFAQATEVQAADIGLALPDCDDTGRGMSKAEMWSLAQASSTFEDEDLNIEEDPPDPVVVHQAARAGAGASSTAPPKEQVASPALVNSAKARRKTEATHFCTFNGCKATFTAKHNLLNHLNSHYRIKSHACAQCERDFGTAHVLSRHRRICKGKKKLFPAGKGSE